MGGTKKKSISQAEKAQLVSQRKVEKRGKAQQAQQQAKRVADPLKVPQLDERQFREVFGQMKAITIYSTARALGIKASTAAQLLRNLEAKKLIRRVAGYSGHRVYAVAG
jgi:small subunit ribosomal protein S25e